MAYNALTKTVDTIPELRTLKGVAGTAARVQTLGGAAAGDGKGGWYLWDNASTATDDGVNNIKVTGVTTGRYIRIADNGATLHTDNAMMRLGNFAYNALDPNNGEYVNFKKETAVADGTPIVGGMLDNVLLKQMAGEYFMRVIPFAVSIEWFGGKGDYDARHDVGTANDAAFQQMLNTMAYYERFVYASENIRWWGSAFVAYIPKGNWLFTQKKFTIQTNNYYSDENPHVAHRGIKIMGDGKYLTNIFFKCPESGNGTDNYWFYNQNSVRDMLFTGLRFTGVTGTERLYSYYSEGSASSLSFVECAFDGNFKVGIDVTGNTNCSENRFTRCSFKNFEEGQVAININNLQSVNWAFDTCDAEGIAGTLINVTAGGAINWTNGSIISTGNGTILKLTDTTGAGIGANNGTFTFTGVKTEIRDKSKFIDCNAVAGIITLQNCFMEINNAASALKKAWATDITYAVGDVVYIGGTRGRAYTALVAHTSDATTQPGVGSAWTTYWSPNYEIDMTTGILRINGGKCSAQIAMRYKTSDVITGQGPKLFVNGTYIDRQPADLVDFVNTDNTTNTASIPKASFFNMTSGTGLNVPYDVSLNHRAGYNLTTVNPKTFIYRFNAYATARLPGAGSTGSFQLPRGATILEAGIVSEAGLLTATYTISNSEKTFLSASGFESIAAEIKPYVIDTDAKRSISITSNGLAKQGFVYIIYN